MSSTQKLSRVLRSLLHLLEEEAQNNPVFAAKLEEITSQIPGKVSARSSKRQNLTVPDVLAEFQSRGEMEFGYWLRTLDIATLKAIVKVNGFDPGKGSKRWNDPDKFRTLVLEQVALRLKRGSAFLTKREEKIMRRKTLRFKTPKDVTPPGLDGIVVRYPYTAVDTDLVGSPEEHVKTSTHAFDVAISRSRRISWDVSDAGLVKVLFEIGKRKLSELFQTKHLPEHFKMDILTNTHPKACPFDPNRIQEPDGTVVELESGSSIGFGS